MKATYRILDFENPGVRIFVIRIMKVAVFAEDLVGIVDGPIDLALLRTPIAVRARNEVNARSVRDQAKDFLFRK